MIASLEIGEDGGLELRISLNLEAAIAGIGAGHSNTDESAAAPRYNRLRALPPAEVLGEFQALVPRFLGQISLMLDGRRIAFDEVSAEIPEVGDTDLPRLSLVTLKADDVGRPHSLSWRLDPALGDSVIRLAATGHEGSVRAEFVRAGETAGPLALESPAPPDWRQAFATYLEVGYVHILPKGLDHILFVVGLFLSSAHLRPLLWQVTSFTLAHSVSLALAMLGLVEVPASIVEPLIAASIVYVAVENVLTRDLKRWRPLVVFGFGLLHGLGFAGVLAEIGLSSTHFFTGLVAFNLGVELGQLTVIAACFATVGLWFRSKTWYRRAITMPASLAIAGIAAFWFAERLV